MAPFYLPLECSLFGCPLLHFHFTENIPKPSENPFITYNTSQSDFAEVLRKFFQKADFADLPA